MVLDDYLKFDRHLDEGDYCSFSQQLESCNTLPAPGQLTAREKETEERTYLVPKRNVSKVNDELTPPPYRHDLVKARTTT